MPLSLGLSFPFAGNRVAGQIARTAAPDGQGKEADVLLTARGDIARAVAFARGRPPPVSRLARASASRAGNRACARGAIPTGAPSGLPGLLLLVIFA